jgi:hypothetical protein
LLACGLRYRGMPYAGDKEPGGGPVPEGCAGERLGEPDCEARAGEPLRPLSRAELRSRSAWPDWC